MRLGNMIILRLVIPLYLYKFVISEVTNHKDIQWCLGNSLKTLDPPGPITGLLSFPGSGNTWLRYLIQKTTGILTGSVYNDKRLRNNGFPGEHLSDGTVIAIKSHLNSVFG